MKESIILTLSMLRGYTHLEPTRGRFPLQLPHLTCSPCSTNCAKSSKWTSNKPEPKPPFVL
ncbi:uncharacterized protein EI90DRAFT_3064946 [Cantharellus anzutake]|uniref:uncharacterized protein n=1 Tax=Cantharellus anzutake TaxID=1750568 RepID=UPI001907CA08|nr:uncharacterized protein EI90DRAFT_3064946 [Cantharellus anzutake]KAF8328347.1 hypothetical protein EI90DRAFT_3064946 [Cantharellus anzutake]